MVPLGINPIEYRAWSGKRTGRYNRLYFIAGNILRHKLKSKGILVLLVFGILITHITVLILYMMAPHRELTADMMAGPHSMYIGMGVLSFFSMLLAAVITSDLISEDIRSNSFVLYFSRPLRCEDYILGKFAGAFSVMAVFCAIPPIILSIVMIGTQTGADYGLSARVLGTTVVAGAFTAAFLLPYGLMVSSFTKRGAYAAVGAFVSFFVLQLIGVLFSSRNFTNDPNWTLISPLNIWEYTYNAIYGFQLPDGINTLYYVVSLLGMVMIPAVVLYLRILSKGGWYVTVHDIMRVLMARKPHEGVAKRNNP